MSNIGRVSRGGRRSSEDMVDEFRAAMEQWLGAVQAHTMAPPDPGFADRLAAFAAAARSLAIACREMEQAGYVWPAARKADSDPPYELRPGTGRRGPEKQWERFDRAVRAMVLAAAGTDLAEVADAYDDLGAITEELAEAVAAEDAVATRPARRADARRSA